MVKGLEIAAAVAGVLGVVIALVAYVFPRGPDRQRQSPPAQAAPAPPTTGTGTSSSAAPPATPSGSPPGTLLTAIPPSAGRDFVSRASRAGQLVLPCPRDATQNAPRTVTYPLRGNYHRFAAAVRISGSPAVAGRTALEVLADDERKGIFAERGDISGTLDVALTVRNPYGAADPAYAQSLSLRLTCELTGPTVTLTNPTLTGD
jgi:hypothetical protein